jgi:hypothetical protein
MGDKVEKMNIKGGNVNVYTGPKEGKFYMNKSGKKVYLNRNMLQQKVPYKKGTNKKNISV